MMFREGKPKALRRKATVTTSSAAPSAARCWICVTSAMCSTICTGRRSRKSPQRIDVGPDVTCARCDGTHWVCENHSDRPWDGPKACGCGAAADPARSATTPRPTRCRCRPDLKTALPASTSCARC